MYYNLSHIFAVFWEFGVVAGHLTPTLPHTHPRQSAGTYTCIHLPDDLPTLVLSVQVHQVGCNVLEVSNLTGPSCGVDGQIGLLTQRLIEKR